MSRGNIISSINPGHALTRIWASTTANVRLQGHLQIFLKQRESSSIKKDNNSHKAAECHLPRIEHDHDIVLAGLPRSGSTLTCHLINKLPDAVALNEPMNIGHFKDQPDKEAICNNISEFFVRMRGALEKTGTAMSKHIDGVVPDNPVLHERTSDGLRRGAAILGSVDFSKNLPDNFTLVVKHPSTFAALVPELINHFTIYATIRNPVAVLSSWNSVSMPIQDGHAPKGENMDTELRDKLKEIPDRLDRQMHLLCWFFERFSLLPAENIINYETLISSEGSCLRSLAASAASLKEPLESRNQSDLYDAELTPVLVERLLRERDAAFWDFYSRESVEAFVA